MCCCCYVKACCCGAMPLGTGCMVIGLVDLVLNIIMVVLNFLAWGAFSAGAAAGVSFFNFWMIIADIVLVLSAWKRNTCGVVFYEVVTMVCTVVFFIYFAGNLLVIAVSSIILAACEGYENARTETHSFGTAYTGTLATYETTTYNKDLDEFCRDYDTKYYPIIVILAILPGVLASLYCYWFVVANSLRKEILDDKMAAEGGGMVMIQQQQPGAYPGEPSPMYPPPQEPMFAQPVGAGGGAGIKNGGFQGDNQEPNDPFAPEY